MNRIIIVLFLSACLIGLEGCKQGNETTVKYPAKQIPTKQKPAKQKPVEERVGTEENLSALTISEAIPEQNDIELRIKFKQEIQQLLADKEFEKLEQIETELTVTKAKFPGGDWKIGRFMEAFGSDNITTEEEWAKYFSVLEEWKTRRPESELARLLLAEALVGYGWMARGDGYASEVTDTGFMVFNERLHQAENVLQEIQNGGKKHLNYYNVKDRIARGLGWNLSKYNEFFDEAIEIEPLYWEFYQNKAIVLMPRWQGQPGDWEAFAEDSANKIGGDQGDILYAEICWQISQFLSGSEFRQDSQLDWSRIKRGFILLEKYYGVSYRYLNAFAIIATKARDNSTKILFQRIGDNWEPDFYNSKEEFEKYRDRAANLP